MPGRPGLCEGVERAGTSVGHHRKLSGKLIRPNLSEAKPIGVQAEDGLINGGPGRPADFYWVKLAGPEFRMAPDPLPTPPARESEPGLNMSTQQLLIYGRPPEKSGGADGHRPKELLSQTACLAELAGLAFGHPGIAAPDFRSN